jgi:hypothetical protein
MIKCSTGKLREMLRLRDRRIRWEYIPEDWLTSSITPIHRTGCQKNPRNYRKIAVICSIGRIYSKVLRNLIERGTDARHVE